MPRCKKCNEKFEQYQFNNKYCKEIDCQTEKGMDLLRKSKEKKEKDRKKEWNAEKKAKAPYLYPKKYKGFLDKECQKLARMIDNKFQLNCIDCERPFGKQQDGGHFNSKGKNRSLAWNLHNIHSQRSECNRNGLGGGRERQYYDGLISRYGVEYAELVDVGLQVKYPYIGLKDDEIGDKLELVRKLIRDFNTFVLRDGIQAREMFNNLIGIYK
jgi:hypothetical protein